MRPVLVFFGVAALVGCLGRGMLLLRLRRAGRHAAASDAELCQLEQAKRFSGMALIASLVGLAAGWVVYVILHLS